MGDIIRLAARPFSRAEAEQSIRLCNPFMPRLLDELAAAPREQLIERTMARSRREPAWAEQQRLLFDD